MLKEMMVTMTYNTMLHIWKMYFRVCHYVTIDIKRIEDALDFWAESKVLALRGKVQIPVLTEELLMTARKNRAF